jgi:hypothetical protein
MDAAKPGQGLPLFEWKPPERVIPFPLARRRDFVWRQANQMARMRPDKANEYLRRQLEQQRSILQRKGIRPERIETELDALARTILAALGDMAGPMGGAA